MFIKIIYISLLKSWFSMNKIKFLKFDILCLNAVYPLTVIFEHIYEM